MENVYSKADKVSKEDEQDFAEFAFLGVGTLVRTKIFYFFETVITFIFPGASPLDGRNL